MTTAAPTGPLPGDKLELTVGEAVHGGWCIARPDDRGRVIFLRHALPGERVRAVITQVTAKLARADAVEILEPSADRVQPPCPHARPGGCGGCDWQHASLPAQRRLKAAVIRQQLSRIANLDHDVTVEPLPIDPAASDPEASGTEVSGNEAGDADRDGTAAGGNEASGPEVSGTEASGNEAGDAGRDGRLAGPSGRQGGSGGRAPRTGGPGVDPRADTALGWRTRVAFAVGRDGRAGLRKHRSHEIIDVGECPIAHPEVNATGVTGHRWPGARSVQVAVVPSTGERGLLVTGSVRGRFPEVAADTVVSVSPSGTRASAAGRGYLTWHAAGRDWRVNLAGFWQVHPGAADTLAAAVLAALAPNPGDVALDLYCGAGLFAGVLAPAVGPQGRVIAVETDAAAVRDARHNLREWPWARVHRGDAGEVLSRHGLSGASIAVLDPPRAGVDQAVIDALLGAAAAGGLRRIAYVSCDPATLARDLRLLTAGGWALDGLRAFDAFPMTHHVECLATLSR